ncbi:hypothetical protein [Psychrobacter sanguinis]|uniref:hypothetical protein n=1 Tax=Psychrobacter sanguinis TaxID=861445 RepID=UPI00020C8F2E|nr:hypothetical protein [Psychrobacter sanguinis]EGK15073.1 hypothetical protein HMPREF9373_0450 [Psychrobacter sp. 1501(2011)]MCD9151153.1 hypothetical protein [Psychrobacter sanguinis]
MKPLNLSKISSALFITGAALMLTACGKSETTDPVVNTEAGAKQQDSEALIKQHAAMFSGCYTVSHDEPAQIKVSQQQQGLVMQMKEPKSANRVWDDPEPLEVMPMDKVSKYFSVDPKNVEGIIGRPDRVLVMAQVKQAYVNIDPTLDSQYLGYILQGANTIYKVECDDTPAEDLSESAAQNKDSVGNITIKPAGNVATQ